MSCRAALIDSPLGPLLAVLDDAGALLRLDFHDLPGGLPEHWHGLELRNDPAALAALAGQLGQYFAGRRRHFEQPLAPHGSAFQQRVWQALQEVPWGHTQNYGELARRLQPASSARAVGRANGLNPIVILIPCHRIIGADGQLTGYSAGLERKQALLALEGALPAAAQWTLL